MDDDQVKKLFFKIIEIEPDEVSYQWVWYLGDYVITVEEYFWDDVDDKHFSISFTKRGGFQSIRKTVNNLSTKEFLEAKLKLIESKARYEENVLNTVLKLTGSATLNNKMDCLLEETEYEKECKKHE